MQPNSALSSSTTILVVEDDENDSFMLVRELKRAHLDDVVTLIPNGYAALNFLLESSQAPLVMFLDLDLPGMGGLQLLRRIRQVARLQKLPVIVMSGSVNPEDRKQSAECGVSAFLAKPVSLSDFIKIIGHLFPERGAV